MEANNLIYNLNNMEFQCKSVDLQNVILVEIILEYCDLKNEEENNKLDLYRHSAKLYIPKDKIKDSFIERELEKTGGNYMKVIVLLTRSN
jgi:hypothetical protein